MINKTKFFTSQSYSPYRNLAYEEYLLFTSGAGEAVLYLWQNDNTVVIGKNQSAHGECNLAAFEKQKGNLARRLSGGGAVYHDMGNMNFTFISSEIDYSVEKNQSIIIEALKKLGIDAEISGRNDIVTDGRKISGNAFYKSKGRAYHHGTILVGSDFSKMSEFLNVDALKLKSHGVKSVKSRVGNLRDMNHEVDLDKLKKAFFEAFSEAYGLVPEILIETCFDGDEIDKLEKKYSSEEWLFQKKIKADITIKDRFSWGGIEFNIVTGGRIIDEMKVYTDSLDSELAQKIEECLTGRVLERENIISALKVVEDIIKPEVLPDLIDLFCKHI